MKLLTRDILPFQEADFFSPIRDKVDFAKLMVLSSRLLLLNFKNENLQCKCAMKLIIDKMSRIFFYKDDKFFSVSFPFNTVIENEAVTQITTYSGREVNNKTISTVISILHHDNFKYNPSPVDYYFNANDEDTVGLTNGIGLLEEIFQFEPSYIRYDCDPDNENGKLHPLHHLDVNYSAYGTYKIGLDDVIISTYFENILNISTDCSFLKK